MRFDRRKTRPALAGSLCVLLVASCGGRGGILSQVPITVILPISTVEVMPAGSPVIVPIQIDSTGETALVSLYGLPVGVQAAYAASDTNPSGSLTFSANAMATTGTSMPTVTVMSAGQTATAQFTLIVKAM